MARLSIGLCQFDTLALKDLLNKRLCWFDMTRLTPLDTHRVA